MIFDDDIQEHINFIEEALRAVSSNYFILPTTYRRNGITRERIFCYELYHQIRCLRGDSSPLLVQGEIDKRGHRDFDEAHRANPDFVFHVPGTHANNKVVVEVKGKMTRDGIRKDFNTLLNFTEFYQYQLGIFVLFGHSVQELSEQCKDVLAPLTQRATAPRIIIMAIKHPHGGCEKRKLIDF